MPVRILVVIVGMMLPERGSCGGFPLGSRHAVPIVGEAIRPAE